PVVALLPGALLLLHPALHLATATAAGRLDLFALAGLLLGAWLTTLERSAWVALGVLLLFAAVLAAPSGAVLAALGAFVLVERRPTMQRGAALLLVYGAARAFGAPWLGALLDPGAFPPRIGVDGAGWRALLEGVAAAHVPVRPGPFVPASGPGWAAALPGAAFLLAALVLPPERRFGGRFLGWLGLVALGLAALAARQDGALPPSAVAPGVLLLAVWVAGIGDDVDRRPARRAVALGLALLLLGGSGFLAWRTLGRLDDPRATFASVAPAVALGAAGDARSLVALRASLSSEPAIRRFERAERLLAGGPGDGAAAPEVDRDVAVAAALAGSPERAAPLLERARTGAARRGDAALADAILLDLLDVHLRESRPALALERIERRGEVDDARLAAELRCREGLAWFLVAFQPGEDGRPPATDVRDRVLVRARRALEAAVEAAPDAPRPRLELGRLELALGRPIEAVKHLEACASASPGLAAPHVELARLYFTLGEDPDGERELARARERAGKEDPEVRLVTAQLRVARGDVLGAVEMAEGLKADVHRLRGARGALGELYAILSRAAEDQRNLGLAAAMARNALDLAPDRSGEVTARLARVLRQERAFEEVVTLLERAETKGIPVPELEAEIAQAYKNAGYAHLLAQERRAALDDFAEALRRTEDVASLGAVPKLVRELVDEFADDDDVDPSIVTEEARRLFERGVEAFAAEEIDRAGDLFAASLALLPRNPYAHLRLALVRERQGRLDEAREALRAAILTGEALGRDDVVDSARQRLDDLD
ncbi:MAG: tetratricopeptide repeat protein, partial [Planctomycetota bacterium JB042]